jgi:hypothetical protein
MRVNLISSFGNHTGLTQDVSLMRGILTAVFEKDVQMRGVPHVFPHCEEAEVNIFLEVINPSLFAYARKNIWIPNLEWSYKTWEPYFHMVDEIWVKTREAEDRLKSLNIPCKYIGWTSIDKVFAEKVNFTKAIVPVGKNIFRNPRPIFQAYMKIAQESDDLYHKLPTLYVPFNPNHIQIQVPPSITDKVVLLDRDLKETEYDEMLKDCGLCICTSAVEGFGHAVNECMSVGMNLILSPIRPFKEDLTSGDALFAEILDQVEQPDCFGRLVDVTSDSIVQCLKTYVARSFREKRATCDMSRSLYEVRHKEWVARMKEVVASFRDIPLYELKHVFPKEEDLPDISIITLTKDRREFMPLAKYCYLIQTYPADKLEWVIVDDGDDPIEDELFGIPHVTYVKSDPGMTIAQKRNLGVSKASYDVLAMMDDDDVYPENSILHRVAMMMKEPAKECAFCTTIPCYDIVKYNSFMNVPPNTLHMSERVSEATLIFTRAFWEETPFDETVRIAEGDAFIRGREQVCREVSPQEVIVSLVHPKNSSSRKSPDVKEPNGCHYGFNEKLFALVSEIGIVLADKQLNTSGQTGSDETSCASVCGDEPRGDGDGDHLPQAQQPLP